MSRIGKTPITVPADVGVTIDSPLVTVKGRKGELSRTIPAPIMVAFEEGQTLVSRPDDKRASRSLRGLTRTLIANMIIDVTEGYKRSLEIIGTGYRVVAKGKNLEFALGFSHPIIIEPAEGIEFTVESQAKFVVHDTNRQPADETATRIRKLKKPEPYKGKGIRYVGRTIHRKVGKAGK